MSSDVTTTDPSVAAGDPAVANGAARPAFLTTAGDRASKIWAPIEALLNRLGDYLNPILVKETRQALKSFQFTMTFVLVLVACWVVTIGGVAWIGPGIFYAAAGGTLLLWYYAVLAFPLAVVVPYSAFRSLAAEREDNTYDLLSITTLKPRQIISGKLGSSVVQMAVYFSAITPCLAFTYLLRGVDVPTIIVLLVYSFFGSLGLCMIGLLLATLSRQRFGQVILSVAFVAGLLFAFISALGMATSMLRFSYAILGGNEFWILVWMFATNYATTFALAFFAATAMITFPSENRSTPLRICMLLQMATFSGWFGFAWVESNMQPDVVSGFAAYALVYWYTMGTMLTAERPEMSQRVKRGLPDSFFGRIFLTWLNPGPSSGYFFVVANASAIVVLCLLAVSIGDLWGTARGAGFAGTYELPYLLPIGWGYLVAYLGLGLLVVRALRQIAVVTMLACVLIHFLLVLAGSGIPLAIQLMSIEGRYADYSFIQIANPFWSLRHVAVDNVSGDNFVLLILVPAAAICMLLLNLPGVLRELREVRVAPPKRVQEDDADLHPEPAPMPASPWDVPAAQ